MFTCKKTFMNWRYGLCFVCVTHCIHMILYFSSFNIFIYLNLFSDADRLHV